MRVSLALDVFCIAALQPAPCRRSPGQPGLPASPRPRQFRSHHARHNPQVAHSHTYKALLLVKSTAQQGTVGNRAAFHWGYPPPERVTACVVHTCRHLLGQVSQRLANRSTFCSAIISPIKTQLARVHDVIRIEDVLDACRVSKDSPNSSRMKSTQGPARLHDDGSSSHPIGEYLDSRPVHTEIPVDHFFIAGGSGLIQYGTSCRRSYTSEKNAP